MSRPYRPTIRRVARSILTIAPFGFPGPSAQRNPPVTDGPSMPGIVIATVSVLGSIRLTDPWPDTCVTHTDPAPTVSASGRRPTGTVDATVRLAGSTRDTVSPSLFDTQTDPKPVVTAVGPNPTAT